MRILSSDTLLNLASFPFYMNYITKTRYTHGLWCPDLLWYEVNAKEKLPAPDADSLANMEDGTRVGELATSLYTDGKLIEGGFQEAVAWTKQAIRAGKTIFEAALPYENLYCKVDILRPSGDGWELIEVKKSTKVKPEHLDDVAFQLYVAEKAGLKITAVKLMHIDTSYERHGELELDKLFHAEDVTAEARAKLSEVPQNIVRLEEMLKGPAPALSRIHMCNNPYDCVLSSFDNNPLGHVYWGGNKIGALINDGVTSWAELPDAELTAKQLIQKQVMLSGKMHIDKAHLAKFLSTLVYPLYHVDFETVNPAVPLFDGTHPYEQVPFQVSLHVEQADGSLEHFEYLAAGEDPRQGVIDVLRRIGPTGSVVAYDAKFEKGRINRLGLIDPTLLSLNKRVVDLIIPFKEFWIHDPAQKGSNSLKAVLPALTGKSYDGMLVPNALTAQQEYMRLFIRKEGTDAERAAYTIGALAYCCLDTLAMVDIVKVLKGLV